MSDPEIYTDEKNVDGTTENQHAPAWFEVSRWPDASERTTEFYAAPRRKRALRDKRAFDKFRRTTPLKRLMTGEEFVIRLGNGGDLVAKIAWHVVLNAITLQVALACREAHRRLVLAFAIAMRHGGYLGVAATYDELAKVTRLSPRHTRRVIAELVELGLLGGVVVGEELVAPVPLFTRYGCASSQRGNAYFVSPFVYAAVDVARHVATPMAGHRARAEMVSHPDTNSGVLLDLPKEREALLRMAGHGRPSAGVEPEFFSAAAPDAAADVSGPVARQGESCSTGPEAPDRASHDEFRALFSRYLTGGAS